jgi:hypothetical protein
MSLIGHEQSLANDRLRAAHFLTHLSSACMNHAASSALSRALNSLWRRGWFSTWPSADDRGSFLWASFQMLPEDADAVEGSLTRAIDSYGGRTRWTLLRREGNRSTLCPTAVVERAAETDGLQEAANLLRAEFPELERQAALDLHSLIDSFQRGSPTASVGTP